MSTLEFLTILILLTVILMHLTDGFAWWVCTAATFVLLCCWIAALITEARTW